MLPLSPEEADALAALGLARRTDRPSVRATLRRAFRALPAVALVLAAVALAMVLTAPMIPVTLLFVTVYLPEFVVALVLADRPFEELNSPSEAAFFATAGAIVGVVCVLAPRVVMVETSPALAVILQVVSVAVVVTLWLLVLAAAHHQTESRRRRASPPAAP